MIKCLLILFLVFFLSVIGVSGLEFSVIMTPLDQTIQTNETAVYDVWLTHDSNTMELFEVYSPEISWDVRTNIPLHVTAESTLRGIITVRPMNVNSGMYLLPLIFKSVRTGETIKKGLPIGIQPELMPEQQYLPAIKGVADIDNNIDPREGIKIRIQIENQNKRELPLVNVKVRSKTINKDYSTSLKPLEKKLVTFKAELPLGITPQKDTLQVSVIISEQEKAYQFDLKPVVFEIIPYSVVDASVNEIKSFIKKVKQIKFTNTGNIPKTHTYTQKIPFYNKIFTRTNIKSIGTKDGEKFEIELTAGETKELEITTNYRLIIWFLIIVVLLISSYFYFRKPIIVLKKARVEGEKGQLKVMISLKNRGKKTIKDVKILDLVSPLAHYVEDSTSLSPTKITHHERKGTVLKWEIGDLEPGEQILVTYKIKSKLAVFGGLTLPVAAVKYTIHGQEKETTSNKAVIDYE